jgi:hypothetical protein
MVLGGLLLMAYSDPAISAGFGSTNPAGTTRQFTSFSFTRTAFTFTGTGFPFNGTFPFNRTSGIPTRISGGGRGISTTTQAESFVGLGLVAVGILLEVFTLLLLQPSAEQKGQTKLPGKETGQEK